MQLTCTSKPGSPLSVSREKWVFLMSTGAPVAIMTASQRNVTTSPVWHTSL